MLAVRTIASLACAMRVQALLALVCNYSRTLLPALALTLLVLGSGTSWAQTVVPPTPGRSPTPAELPPPEDPDPTPYDDATVVGISAPATMAPGATAYVAVTLRNSGTTTWSSATSPYPYLLGSTNPANNYTWGRNRVTLPASVAPGGQVAIGFTITAPSTLGTYSFSWSMLREQLHWFGGSASSTITVSAPAPVYDAQLVPSSVPSTMTAGSYYNVSMTFKNTGNVTWTSPDYLLGNADDLTTFGISRVAMSVASVAPGQSAVFNFQLRAPATPGSYTTQWGMLWEYHMRFGQTSRTNVTVNPATTTPQPTISVSRPALVAGQSFTTTWSTTNATSLKHVCTASGTGYAVNESLALNGSRSLTAQSAWISYPSSCTWTASGAGGSAIYTETMSTAAGSNGSVTYIHTDGLGSPIARTDAAGKVISRTRYEPYGYVASGVQPTIGFTGHVNDADTGLTYMKQRYYDPVAGRFLSIDPVVTDANTGSSFNRYVYAINNPYRYVDPDGRDVTMLILRSTPTEQSVPGTISVWSSKTDEHFGGNTLENVHAGDHHDKPPISQGEYGAKVRTDHSPNRVELKDVPGYKNVQIHVGNTPKDVKGCFAVGTSPGKNSVGGSKSAISSILGLIKRDGGAINVIVVNPPKPNEKPVQNFK